jgi:hypothetical protein
MHVVCTRSTPRAPSSSHRRRTVVARPSRRRVLKALQALPLQALHLAYETGPPATYDVPAEARLGYQVVVSSAAGLGYQVVVSSAAGLIITVTDGAGEVIEREAGPEVTHI